MPAIPATMIRHFQEFRVEDLDLDRHADLIIERALELGTRADLRWLFATYGTERIRDLVRRRGLRKLSRRACVFWSTVLEVRDYSKPPWFTDRSLVWKF